MEYRYKYEFDNGFAFKPFGKKSVKLNYLKNKFKTQKNIAKYSNIKLYDMRYTPNMQRIHLFLAFSTVVLFILLIA